MMPSFTEREWADIRDAHAAEVLGLREQLATFSDPLDYAALCAELNVENSGLRRQGEQLTAVRVALRTPDGMDIVQWATQIAQAAARDRTQGESAATMNARILSVQLATVRQALGTPDGMDITHHAAQVAAELQRARVELAEVAPDAAKWRAVPWRMLEDISWTIGPTDDALHDLRMYVRANKPQEVTE
jgi:hypothetical protein